MVTFKTIFFTLASVIVVNADWRISFTYADGGQIEAHGFKFRVSTSTRPTPR
jgi:hypothetical protein